MPVDLIQLDEMEGVPSLIVGHGALRILDRCRVVQGGILDDPSVWQHVPHRKNQPCPRAIEKKHAAPQHPNQWMFPAFWLIQRERVDMAR